MAVNTGGDEAMTAVVDRHSKSNGQGQGMNFVRPEKRIALYLRDGLACCYCGSGIEDGVKLTLDHLTPHSLGGSHHENNLVTACHKCNSARGNRPVEVFAAATAAYLNHGITAEMILRHIDTTRNRPLDVPAAKAILANRGGFTQAMESLKS